MKTIVVFLLAIGWFCSAQAQDSVYTTVEKDAKPVGGMAGLYKAIADQPWTGKNTCNVWKVFVEFIIEKDGTMSNIRMARDSDIPCERFWLDPIKKISDTFRWQPAEVEGKAVRQRIILPMEIKPG